MALPNSPVTLTVEQIDQLNRHLSTMRHEINNYLTHIVAAAELIRCNPEMVQRWSSTLLEQPHKVTEEMTRFTVEFEKALGIARLPEPSGTRPPLGPSA